MASAKVPAQFAARGNWIAVAMHVSDLKYLTYYHDQGSR